MKKLQIGSFLLVLFMFSSQGMADFAFIPISNDADSQISTDIEYTHAIDFGSGTVANVNGVQFAKGGVVPFPAQWAPALRRFPPLTLETTVTILPVLSPSCSGT